MSILRNNSLIENNNYMKVAVLFRGQPRFVKNKVAYDSHKKFIFDNYDTDVFIHTWWAEDIVEYDTSTWANIPVCKPESDVVEFIKSLYNPKKIEVEKLNYTVVQNLTIPLSESEICERLCRIEGLNYFNTWRDEENLYITFWR